MNKHDGQFDKNQPDIRKELLYPDYSVILTYISNLFKIDTENILLTAGADDGIRLVSNYFKHSKGLYLQPDWERYLHWANANQIKYETIPLNLESFAFPEAAIHAKLKNNVDYICISTIGNPTGYISPNEFIINFEQNYSSKYLLLDETYSYFLTSSWQEVSSKSLNIISINSFSKAFAPGLRIGFIVASTHIINALRNHSLMFPVSSLSVEYFYKQTVSNELLRDNIKIQINAKNYLSAGLSKRNASFFASYANWILLNTSMYTIDFYTYALNKDIYIKSFGNTELKEWVRISTTSINQAIMFLELFDEFCIDNLASQSKNKK